MCECVCVCVDGGDRATTDSITLYKTPAQHTINGNGIIHGCYIVLILLLLRLLLLLLPLLPMRPEQLANMDSIELFRSVGRLRALNDGAMSGMAGVVMFGAATSLLSLCALAGKPGNLTFPWTTRVTRGRRRGSDSD